MKTIKYSITFFDYWHCGSGLIGGVDAQTTVLKNEKGFPFIPGKTLKGMLRDAARAMNQLSEDYISKRFIKNIFGTEGKAEYDDEMSAFFSNSELSEALQTQISEQQRANLFERIASTAINEKGVAVTGTLRQMEVCIPLTLQAYIADFPDDKEFEDSIKKCFQWIKRMGVNRNRGLGRCKFEYLNIV